MRLTSIKLAGFKSFVDPTHFQLPGQIIGVVGPNGCGKSNIIDAVRWVLGESRASELRGESMQDVIFNGSTVRKPGSRASVELVFDNADGRAAGQWSTYAEIAVKRVLARDGMSSYYINNLPARRRDIQDIFLGTGLGPRAYAIIGQNLITRLIEAKPEELRMLLEEAAGVSKYKERRRETENRLHDTRENLTRVEDIMRELAANLEKLEDQAVVATKFRELQTEGEEKQHLLWLLRRNEAAHERERQQHAIEQAQTDLEAQMAKLREVEAQLETLRAANYTASDAMQAVQGALYEANAEVSRIEAQIQFIVESRNRMEAQIAALAAQHEQWRGQVQKAQSDECEAVEQLAVAEEKAHLDEQDAIVLQDALPSLEARWRDAQTELNDERAAIVRAEQSLQHEATQQRNVDQMLQQLQQRHERLKLEEGTLDAPNELELEDLRRQLFEQEAALCNAQAQLADAQETLPHRDEMRRDANEKVQIENVQLHQIEARLAALRQLQESVQTEGRIEPWLARHELNALPRLWKKLHVEAGWETALEAVLRERLAALEISNLDWVRAFSNDAPPAKLAFYTPPAAAQSPATPVGLTPLLSLVYIDDAGLRAVLTEWLNATFVADDLAQALAQRSQLPTGGAFVVKNGHLVTRVGIQLYAVETGQDGLLARQQEIENLARQSHAQALLAEDARAVAVRAEAAYAQAAEKLAGLREQTERTTQHVHMLQMNVLKFTQRHEHYAARSTQIRGELEEITAQLEEQRALREQSIEQFEQRDVELAELQTRFENDRLAFEALDTDLGAARTRAHDQERTAADARFAVRNMASRIEELRRNIQTAREQSQQITLSLDNARIELETINGQTSHTGLQDALHVRAQREEALRAARMELDDLGMKLRQTDEARLSAERALQPLRERITGLQLKEQAARLNGEQFIEQLKAGNVDEAALQQKLTGDMKPSYLQGEVTRISNAITELGPVNMAALDELAIATERRKFLDAQSNDLMNAISTLENAIRKIDQETRALLQETFNEVNRHLGELFPRLFNGGQAQLMMTGDEILDAGVQMMAQPPGKKNATIHLLSGGEKTLTATALVFALFQLNPAPFCLLDEVDSPLDDANTERFTNLVRALSDKTQFLFISHNKIVMEMAQQLIGVTMQEQGVSRIVAVDMETAVGFSQ